MILKIQAWSVNRLYATEVFVHIFSKSIKKKFVLGILDVRSKSLFQQLQRLQQQPQRQFLNVFPHLTAPKEIFATKINVHSVLKTVTGTNLERQWQPGESAILYVTVLVNQLVKYEIVGEHKSQFFVIFIKKT